MMAHQDPRAAAAAPPWPGAWASRAPTRDGAAAAATQAPPRPASPWAPSPRPPADVLVLDKAALGPLPVPPLALGKLGGPTGPPPAPPPPGAWDSPRPSTSGWDGGGGWGADSPAGSRPGSAAIVPGQLHARTAWLPGGGEGGPAPPPPPTAGAGPPAPSSRPSTAGRALPFAGGPAAGGVYTPRPGTAVSTARGGSGDWAAHAPPSRAGGGGPDSARLVAAAAARLAALAAGGPARPPTAAAAPPSSVDSPRPATAASPLPPPRPSTALPPALVSSLRATLAAPAPPAGAQLGAGPAPVRCTVLREKGARGSRIFRLLLEGGPAAAGVEGAAAAAPPLHQLAVAARTGRRCLTIFDAGGPVAVVAGTALGSSYTVTSAEHAGVRLAKVAYRGSLAGGRGPRRVAAVVAVGGGPAGPAGPRPPPSLLALANRPPRWSADAGAYTLDFGGRVTVASVKNCQLVAAGGGGGGCGGGDVLFQFGKTGLDSFALDYGPPLSGLAAFALALTALDGKLACE